MDKKWKDWKTYAKLVGIGAIGACLGGSLIYNTFPKEVEVEKIINHTEYIDVPFIVEKEIQVEVIKEVPVVKEVIDGACQVKMSNLLDWLDDNGVLDDYSELEFIQTMEDKAVDLWKDEFKDHIDNHGFKWSEIEIKKIRHIETTDYDESDEESTVQFEVEVIYESDSDKRTEFYDVEVDMYLDVDDEFDYDIDADEV